MTPLMAASKRGSTDCVTILLEAGADWTKRNGDAPISPDFCATVVTLASPLIARNETAQKIAEKSRHPTTAKLLKVPLC
jgi:ankyrin repeat protein